jgi:dolichol-phosphate mannosyltransferase
MIFPKSPISPTNPPDHAPPPDRSLFSMSDFDVSVIVPTYREAANLPGLVARIHATMRAAGLDVEIIIVDDNSPDETRSVCNALAADHPLRLETRFHERGLSSAVLHGLRLARGNVLVVMDADLSHPPEKIPELVAALHDPDVDFVIGSRYVPGAGTDETWGWFRWLNSKVATLLSRPFTTSADPMAGFFALRRTTFETAATLDPIGYKIGLELIVKCGCKNIREVPIHFIDRQLGESKLTLKEQINYLRHLRRLANYKYGGWASLAQFIVVGLSGMFIDLSSYAALLAWLPLTLARGMAIWAAMSWNFLLNRWITFSYARNDALARQYLRFCLSCLTGAVVNWLTSVVLSHSIEWFATHKLPAAVIGVVAGTGFNFVLCRHWAFRRTKDKPGCNVEPDQTREPVGSEM